MTSPKISLIIPAWNSESYLERCLESIHKQTFSSFEAIVLDSESTDRTPDIVHDYVCRDSRFRYFHHASVPPGSARNIGLDLARAPYIGFADSDDAMAEDMLETMYRAATSRYADIVVCDFNMVYPDRDIPDFSHMQDGNFVLSASNLADYYFRFNAAPKPNNYLWSRLYRREFLQRSGVRFADTHYSEDHLFNLMLNCHMPRIAHIGKSLYNYIQRDDSAVRRSARNSNHGELYYTVFKAAQAYLESYAAPFVIPILSIYAFTRIRSIVFYGHLAGLSGDKLQESLLSFLQGDKVEYYLSLCVSDGHLSNYCQLHDISLDQVQKFQQLLALCMAKEPIQFDKGWFA
jgi:glycosyltransferase involved in cell wall biosynthesis